MTRAPISVGIIAKDAEQTLGACLDSIRPYVAHIVVGVDTYSNDKTPDVATQHGADIVFPVIVSDYHECPQHGRILVQNFAHARNQVLEKQDLSQDFLYWQDADDVLEGAERLPEVCAALPETAIGIWLPYDYARATLPDGRRQTTTTFHRERLLRTQWQGQPLTWTWKHRVHETVAPEGDVPAAWLMVEQPRVVHQDGGHKTQGSAPRNLVLLEIDNEEKPNDPRTTFYLANTYFALGNFPASVHWYQRLLDLNHDNTYERWQSWLYLAKACRQIGDVDGAERAALACLVEQPDHAEAYWAVADAQAAKGQWEKVEYWTKKGRSPERTPPPPFVFKNPLDGLFNQHLPLADAYANRGRIVEARKELEAAYKAMPNASIGEQIEHYRNLETWADVASAWAHLAAGKDDFDVLRLWNAADLPPEVRQFGRTRDIAMPALLRSRPNTQPRIVFWCGRALEEWYPGSLNTTGIGGSETAVVEIARRFAADGWRVDVYNGAGRYEGVYDDVGYWDPERYGSRGEEKLAVFVSWRQPKPLAAAFSEDPARRLLLWCHDLNYGPDAREAMTALAHDKSCKVLGVSAWHAGMLQRYYDLPEGKVDFVPNGVDLTRFSAPVRKLPFRCIYASSPDRGLARLLKLWARLVADEPGSELHIAYGWDNIDKAIAGGRADLAQFKADVEAQIEKTPQVVWRGRLPQDQLAQLYSESYAWLYPTDFLEVSCISAMEAMAGGCVPVTSSVGALKETIGAGGLLVPGNVYGRAWADFYTHIARGVLTNPDVRRPLEFAGRKRAQALTWDKSYDRWKFIVEGLLNGELEPTEPEPATVEERETVLV